MAVRSTVVVVPATAGGILICDGTSGSSTVPVSVVFWNPTGQTVYIGGDDVSSANGVPVAASSWSPSFDLVAGDKLFGIVAATTQSINVLRLRV